MERPEFAWVYPDDGASCYIERLENAYEDIDGLVATGRYAW